MVRPTATTEIDLDSGEAMVRPVPEADVRSLLGGRGLNMLELRRGLRRAGGARRVDPFGPENPLILGAGLLSGTIAPNAARFNVTAKSPETLGLGDANGGGFFAAAMRKAGFDRLVIRGRAARPSYLLLEDGAARLLPADGLWGMSVWQSQEELRRRHGGGTVSAVIGAAGEHQVRMAAVMTGKKNAAARGGLGAVMGSKNLKAIAACGGRIEVDDPARLRDLRIEQTAYLKGSRVVQVLGRSGTPFLYDVSNRLGAIRTRNSQENFFEDTLEAAEIEKYSDRMLACTSCVVHCRHRNTLGGEGPEYSTIGLLGANLGIAPTEQVIDLNNRVNELGLDASSAGSILAWAIELYQRGLIGDELTGGPLVWGDYERVCELLEAIAYRRGFGDLLAESSQAASRFPGEAREYLTAVKDLPQSDPHDVRYIKSFALGIAVASRGADHLRNRPTLDILRLPDDVRRSIFGAETNADPTAYEGKAAMVAWHEDIYAVADALGICKFVTHGFNSPHLLGYEHFAALVEAATGLDLHPDDLRRAGRNIVDLERTINAEFGRSRADDTLPRRYFDEPMPARVTKGHHIDRVAFEAMLDEYYAVRGWDAEGRLPAERAAEIEGWM